MLLRTTLLRRVRIEHKRDIRVDSHCPAWLLALLTRRYCYHVVSGVD
jgi:hypothetical protein